MVDQSHDVWFQDFYRIRKKVLTIGNKYWIEDGNGNALAFSKQKILRLKEDIRIFSDENMEQELFRIQQQQYVDLWGTFAVVDSRAEAVLGYLRSKAFKSSFLWDEWDVLDMNKQSVGGIHESAGLGLLRKYVPGGSIVPERMTLKLNKVPIAEINQQFKIVGDSWELKCLNVPRDLDRRVLLAGILLMGMVERSRK